MAVIITLIICLTILGCVFIFCVHDADADLFDLNKRLKNVEYSLDELVKTQEGLKESISDCDVFIHQDARRMTFMFEVHYYDMQHLSKEQIAKRITEKVEEVHKDWNK